MRLRLAWVTCRSAHGRDHDEPLGLAALAAAGASVDVVDWDDPAADWARFDRVVIRSAWDYPERGAEFDAWLRHIDAVSDVINPPAVMRWSMDKHYLAELAAAGIPITPSYFVEVGQRAEFPDAGAGFVVKPAVGADSRDVVRYPATDAARAAASAQIGGLHGEGRSVVVQPALVNVALLGEWPMVFLGGEYSHTANRRVELPEFGATGDLVAPEITRPATATPEMVAVAAAAIDHVHAHVGVTTYARIDLVLDDTAKPVVMEVELVEPSLFLPEHPEAAARLATLIVDGVTERARHHP